MGSALGISRVSKRGQSSKPPHAISVRCELVRKRGKTMRDRTKRARNFIIVSLMFLLTAWFAMPRSFRRLIQPAAFAAAKTFTVNVTGDGADENRGDGICAPASGNCSLRAAIQEANANAGKDTINFNIPGSGLKTITPGSALPDITGSVIIDGYTQPGASENSLANGDNAVLLIELNGTNAGLSVSGLKINATGSTVKGLVINRFDFEGINLTNSGNTVQGCFIGVNFDGTQALGNGAGIGSTGANLIGGTGPAARNIISGNRGEGLFLDPNDQVLGNFIGTDKTGAVAFGNGGNGVRTHGGGTVVGGTIAGARNVISGNGAKGIEIWIPSGGQVLGNFIGTDVNGSAAMENIKDGGLICDTG